MKERGQDEVFWKIPAYFPEGLLLRTVTVTYTLTAPAVLISLQLFLLAIETSSCMHAVQSMCSIPVIVMTDEVASISWGLVRC